MTSDREPDVTQAVSSSSIQRLPLRFSAKVAADNEAQSKKSRLSIRLRAKEFEIVLLTEHVGNIMGSSESIKHQSH